MSLLAADARAFVAAARKELRMWRRYPLFILGLLFWPIVLPATWVLMGQAYSGGGDARALAAFAERAGTTEFAGFVFVGYAMYMWLSNLLWGPGTALRQEQIRGSLEAVFLTPTSRLVALFAPPISHLPFSLLNFVTMGLTLWLVFGIVLPLGPVLEAMVVIAIGIPSMYAIGSLFAASVLRFGETGPIVQLVRGTFVLACGITFPLVMLPGWAQAGAALLPPTYIVADIRTVLFRGVGLGGIAIDLVLLLAFAGLITLLAVWVFRILETSARRRGTLGSY
ncbi:MAG: ABC transporter permease [Chloroflexi bacterium]|nr:MAG: ABC transporter permease [Chloroflexota bacterium]TMG34696.1 MAG: ABC transporter permease [Chloroflexota bacterium]